MENAHIMLEMTEKCSNYAKNWGLCFPFWIMLCEADYAKNYASILYQCLAIIPESQSATPVGEAPAWMTTTFLGPLLHTSKIHFKNSERRKKEEKKNKQKSWAFPCGKCACLLTGVDHHGHEWNWKNRFKNGEPSIVLINRIFRGMRTYHVWCMQLGVSLQQLITCWKRIQRSWCDLWQSEAMTHLWCKV